MFASPNYQLIDRNRAMRKQYERVKTCLERASSTISKAAALAERIAARRDEDVKVFFAVKRKIQPGDKKAGRHGNKGVFPNIVSGRDNAFPRD